MAWRNGDKERKGNGEKKGEVGKGGEEIGAGSKDADGREKERGLSVCSRAPVLPSFAALACLSAVVHSA